MKKPKPIRWWKRRREEKREAASLSKAIQLLKDAGFVYNPSHLRYERGVQFISVEIFNDLGYPEAEILEWIDECNKRSRYR